MVTFYNLILYFFEERKQRNYSIPTDNVESEKRANPHPAPSKRVVKRLDSHHHHINITRWWKRMENEKLKGLKNKTGGRQIIRRRMYFQWNDKNHCYDISKWWLRVTEFTPPRGVIQPKKCPQKVTGCSNYHLAWHSYWWLRMEREDKADQLETKKCWNTRSFHKLSTSEL